MLGIQVRDMKQRSSTSANNKLNEEYTMQVVRPIPLTQLLKVLGTNVVKVS